MLGSLLEKQANSIGEKTFVIINDKQISYREFNQLVNQTANYLQSAGVSKGTHVALILPNTLDFLLLWFALAKIGAVMVPINTSLKKDVINYIANQSDSEFMFLDSSLDIELDVTELPQVKKLERMDEKQLLTLIHSFPAVFSIPYKIKPSDPMSIVYTSGTTSLPKGAVNSQKCYYEAGKDMAEVLGLVPDDLMYIFLPLFHVNPQFYGVMSSLYTGNPILIDRKFSVQGFWENAQKYHFTVFTYVGTVLSLLCKKTPEESLASTITRCVGGGAPRLIWEEVTNRFGIKVMELYGMTEIGGFTTGNSQEEWKFDSVGKPRDCIEIKIFKDGDEECGEREMGEIVVRPRVTHVIFDGYYKQPDKTLEALSNLWFHTGDCGYFDRDGFLHYCGRIKEIIRRKGENISPFEIETVIAKYEWIEEAAVVGVPDEIAEEEIKACIILKENANFLLADFIAWLDQQLPAFMNPRYLEILPALPKTATQKIEKNKLKYLDDHVLDLKKRAQEKSTS